MTKLFTSLLAVVCITITVNVTARSFSDNQDPSIDSTSGGYTRPITIVSEPISSEENDARCANGATGIVTVGSATPVIFDPPIGAAYQIDLGQSIGLTWAVQLPANCETASIVLDEKSVAAEGFKSFSPMYSRHYPLSVNGRQVAVTFVAVNIVSPVIYIRGSTKEWAGLFMQAVREPGKTVILAGNVDLELWGTNIYVGRGVTITSEPSTTLSNIVQSSDLSMLASFETFTSDSNNIVSTANSYDISSSSVSYSSTTKDVSDLNSLPQIEPAKTARDASHPGPRIYYRAHTNEPLFYITCNIADGENGTGDNVRINGFRLIGPDIGEPVGTDWKNKAIKIRGCKGIDISNMEIAGWSGQAIYIQDIEDMAYPGRITMPSQVAIHDNYFHHNQQKTDGDGYGIEVKHGAYALIERNVFDFNRHAIAAGGEDGTGYTARYNLVLRGGGYHKWDDPLDGPLDVDVTWSTHQFDVHGTDSCGPGSVVSDGLYNCGQAGERFEMSHNAFQYSKGYAIKIRGIPTIGATITKNVFAHSNSADAIHEYTESVLGDLNRTESFDNQFGVNTWDKYGVCDFDGDKKDDLFLATGASWWFMSGANQHWVYLNDSTERLSQLGLGDFDGDHICDVFAVHGNDFGIYKSGKGSWKSLGAQFIPMNQLRFADFNGDGIQDIFRRDPTGQWWIISPGYYDWTRIQSSSFSIEDLRFGDFNGDRIADVIAVENGHWSVSWGGREQWASLNSSLSTDIKNLLIADLDGNGVDDIARYSVVSNTQGQWDISWNGRTSWMLLGKLDFPMLPTDVLPKSVIGYVGHFNGSLASNLLSVDLSRRGKLWNPSSTTGFVTHNRYAY